MPTRCKGSEGEAVGVLLGGWGEWEMYHRLIGFHFFNYMTGGEMRDGGNGGEREKRRKRRKKKR